VYRGSERLAHARLMFVCVSVPGAALAANGGGA